MIDTVQRAKTTISYEFPINYFEGNLFFRTDRTCEAVYKIDGFAYDFLSQEEKIRKLVGQMKLYWNIKLDFQLKVIPSIMSIRERVEEEKRRATGPLKLAAIMDAERVGNILIEQMGDEGNDYDFYLIVKMKKAKGAWNGFKDYISSIFKDPIRTINEYAAGESPDIFINELETYMQLEEQVYNIINNYISAKKANEYDLQRLIRQPFFRCFGEPPLRGEKPVESMRKASMRLWKPAYDVIEKNGKPAIRPYQRDILTLTEGDILIKNKYITITQRIKNVDMTSYQSFMCVSHIPSLDFPGCEWIYSLTSSLNFPVEISIRVHTIESNAAVGKVRNEKKKIKDQSEHTSDSNEEIPLTLLEAKNEADELEYYLQKSKSPLLLSTIIIVVFAKDLETLKMRQQTVKNHLDGFGIQVEIPGGDQWDLFNEVLLGGQQYAYDYCQRITPQVLAGAMFGATKKLGDDSGFYFAMTGTLAKPVWIDPWRPSQINRAPNIEIVGSQGGGKSYLMDLIGCKVAKLGALSLFIDPKGDRTLWPEYLKSFGDQVAVTTFTARDEDKGKLDPFNIMRPDASSSIEDQNERLKQAAALSMDICQFLLAIDRKDPRVSHLLNAVNEVIKGECPSQGKIISQLYELARRYDEASDSVNSAMCKSMADTLNSYRNMAYASLLFGDGDEESVNLNKSINVIQIQNLTFPDENKSPEHYSYQETIGYACLLAITGFIMRFIMSDRGRLGMFFLDETSVINATPVGRNLILKVQRMARALNKPGVFVSQNVADIGDEKVKNNIGYKFAFKSTDVDEICQVLKFFNLEPTKENIEVIQNLENGMCLFQDLEGRTGVICVDEVFDEYYEAFNTTPKNNTYE